MYATPLNQGGGSQPLKSRQRIDAIGVNFWITHVLLSILVLTTVLYNIKYLLKAQVAEIVGGSRYL